MSWIKTIPYERSSGRLKTLYDRVKGPNNYIDNILQIHSLRPHTLEGHMALYKNTLHHAHNKTPKWLLECIGIYVGLLNQCHYCVAHHYQGLMRVLQNDDKAQAIRHALQNKQLDSTFTAQEVTILNYTEQLTQSPHALDHKWIQRLRETGLSDGEILEINQVASYFAYANRTVLGLGCNTDGDILGLSPSNTDDPEQWGHQ